MLDLSPDAVQQETEDSSAKRYLTAIGSLLFDAEALKIDVADSREQIAQGIIHRHLMTLLTSSTW